MQATPAITMATVATPRLIAATLATIEYLWNQSTIEVPAALKAGGHWTMLAAVYTDMEQTAREGRERLEQAGARPACTASAGVAGGIGFMAPLGALTMAWTQTEASLSDRGESEPYRQSRILFRMIEAAAGVLAYCWIGGNSGYNQAAEPWAKIGGEHAAMLQELQTCASPWPKAPPSRTNESGSGSFGKQALRRLADRLRERRGSVSG